MTVKWIPANNVRFNIPFFLYHRRLVQMQIKDLFYQVFLLLWESRFYEDFKRKNIEFDMKDAAEPPVVRFMRKIDSAIGNGDSMQNLYG
ncbi:MAG: hypothetical protein N2645_22675 [Clostridia bacterium]|nr:hypothetical protein [Clostridia bacterium]